MYFPRITYLDLFNVLSPFNKQIKETNNRIFGPSYKSDLARDRVKFRGWVRVILLSPFERAHDIRVLHSRAATMLILSCVSVRLCVDKHLVPPSPCADVQR